MILFWNKLKYYKKYSCILSSNSTC